MSERNRAWLVDLLTALIEAVIVGALVMFAGGPYWAAVGFAWVIYLTRPGRAQAKYKEKHG